MKVAGYMRVGNKEQLELTEEQQKEAMKKIAEDMNGTIIPRTSRIPTPEELKAEGYEVVTLPKKKAWLFMRSSVGIPKADRQSSLNSLKNQAHERGYEVVGETVVVGNSDKSKAAIESLLDGELKKAGADLLFMRGTRDISFKFGEVTEVFDMIKDAGYSIDTADGTLHILEGKTEEGMNVRDIIKSMTVNSEKQPEQTEPNEDQDEGETPTMNMGGGMQ